MKLDDYADQRSEATGLTVFAMLAGLWLLAFALDLMRGTACSRVMLMNPLLLLVGSWTVLVFGGALAAVADRVWQFAWVAALPLLQFEVAKRSRWVLGLCLGVALINVLLRYPLSNFFWPLLPYERIVPLWFAP